MLDVLLFPFLATYLENIDVMSNDLREFVCFRKDCGICFLSFSNKFFQQAGSPKRFLTITFLIFIFYIIHYFNLNI